MSRRASEMIAHDRRQRVLRALAASDGMTAREIALETGMRQPQVTGMLMAMESRHFVQRDSIRQDRKASIWSISTIGRQQI